MNTKQNVVPNGAPRKAILQNGILFRFGFEPITGSGLSKCGEIVYFELPHVDTLREVQQEYCRTHGITEEFVPADYGY